MLEMIFYGEFDSSDPTVIHYTGTDPVYGAISLTFDTKTGAWTASVPVGFPAGVQIKATWQDVQADTIRSEPPDPLNQLSLGTPESELAGSVIVIGGTLSGTIGGTLGYVGGNLS